jgi:hypothetical protein
LLIQDLSIRYLGQRLRRDKPEIADIAIDAASPVNADFDRAIPALRSLLALRPNLADSRADLRRFHRDDSLLLRYPTA